MVIVRGLSKTAAQVARKGSPPSGSRRRAIRASLRAFLNALLADDRLTAISIAERELAELGSRSAVFAQLLHPAQYEIGELWYQGKIGIADEHRATAIVEAIVDRLPSTSGVTASPRQTCLLAAIDGEQHVVGLQMLAAALRDDGWTVRSLPVGSSPDQVLAAVSRLRPRLVGISAGYLADRSGIARTVSMVKSRGVPVIVGGAAFNRTPGLAERVGADAHAPDVQVALVLARKLIGK